MPMAATSLGTWTLEELHRLPDDGNKYELVRGALFVTPAPSDAHETALVRLTRILDRYVEQHRLGHIYHPRAVFRHDGSEVEPDLMVRTEQPRGGTWDSAPTPILIVEVISPTTRRRDREMKRAFYKDAGIPEYWIVDPDAQTITVVRPGRPDVVAGHSVAWHPAAAPAPAEVLLADVFGD